MKSKHSSATDPVCGATVGAQDHILTLEGIQYAFCSSHCRARFVAHPHVYVGYPGEMSARQTGDQVIKRRRVTLEEPLSSEEGRRILTGALRELPGVRDVHLDGPRLEITYDLYVVSADQIEAALADVGVRLGEGWAERFHRAFIHESEEWELDSLAASPTHHTARR